jgi:hypothetical protein
MVFAAGPCIVLRAADSSHQLGEPGTWHEVETPIFFVNKIGLTALERGETFCVRPGDHGTLGLVLRWIPP